MGRLLRWAVTMGLLYWVGYRMVGYYAVLHWAAGRMGQ
jgi:hypothetical protein